MLENVLSICAHYEGSLLRPSQLKTSLITNCYRDTLFQSGICQFQVV